MIWLSSHFWDLPRRTVADNVFRDKAFNMATNPKYDEYQIDLTSMVCKFFDKNTLVKLCRTNN